MTSITNYDKKKKLDDFIDGMIEDCIKYIPETKTGKKVENDNLLTPALENYYMIYQNNYNVQQLKVFAKHYKLKISGNKNEIMFRLFCHLRLSFYATKIQKIFKGCMARKYVKYHGPAFPLKKRGLCNNSIDFFTMEDIKSLSYHQMFSYQDIDGFIYGFDILSLYNLVHKSEGKQPSNPYNRMPIPKDVIQNIKGVIKLSKLLGIMCEIEIKNINEDITIEKSLELRVLELFQNMDSLGNYTNPAWFHSLNRQQLARFVFELRDIYTYRAQLTNEMKRAICPPHGNPFHNFNIQSIQGTNQHFHSFTTVKKMVLGILEKFVNFGIDRDSKSLGAFYVLGALTLVNEDAANTLPWLFHSVSVI
jgi:hypothetical protein